jgi:hypothetical protein
MLNRIFATAVIKWKKKFYGKNTLAYFGTASVKIHDIEIGLIDY